jgi:hypothetical protein
MGDRICAYRVLVVRHTEKNHLENLDLYGRIILILGLYVIWGGLDWVLLANYTDRW